MTEKTTSKPPAKRTKKSNPPSDTPSDPPSDPPAEADDEKEDVSFFGFSTDDDDSSDEELEVEPESVDATKLPTIAKDDAVVKRKLEKAKRKPVRVLFLDLVSS